MIELILRFMMDLVINPRWDHRQAVLAKRARDSSFFGLPSKRIFMVACLRMFVSSVNKKKTTH